MNSPSMIGVFVKLVDTRRRLWPGLVGGCGWLRVGDNFSSDSVAPVASPFSWIISHTRLSLTVVISFSRSNSVISSLQSWFRMFRVFCSKSSLWRSIVSWIERKLEIFHWNSFAKAHLRNTRKVRRWVKVFERKVHDFLWFHPLVVHEVKTLQVDDLKKKTCLNSWNPKIFLLRTKIGGSFQSWSFFVAGCLDLQCEQ